LSSPNHQGLYRPDFSQNSLFKEQTSGKRTARTYINIHNTLIRKAAIASSSLFVHATTAFQLLIFNSPAPAHINMLLKPSSFSQQPPWHQCRDKNWFTRTLFFQCASCSHHQKIVIILSYAHKQNYCKAIHFTIFYQDDEKVTKLIANNFHIQSAHMYVKN
jgi:hypothetical protein